MRNTVGQGKEMWQINLNGTAPDAALREYCDKYYNQLLPILAEKMHQEKVQQEKLKALKARLNFEEVSQHSESGTPSRRRNLRKRLGSRCIRTLSGSPKPRHGRSGSPQKKDPKKWCSKGWRRPWVCEETDPFTPRICYFDLSKRTRMPSHVKTYNGSGDPEDHLKIFQAVEKVERWAMPTWCHMFNSTLTGSAKVWFDDLPPESVDSYDDLKEAFLTNFRQQKKCIKDPVEIHHIKQREGESTEDFVRRFKIESKDVKGAPEIMRILGFMHGITNPELIKHLHDKIPKSVDEMMKITTSFLRGEVAAGNQERKKSLPPWKQHEAGHKQNFKKGGFKNQHRQIEELLKAGKLSHVIKELKQNSGKDQPKTNKKGEASNKDKALAILLIQPWKIQAVPSTAHGMLKFPVARGTLTLKSSKIIPIECVAVSRPEEQPSAVNQAVEERIKVAINPEYPKQTIMIGSTLTKEGRNKLCDLIQRNLDVFAWKPADITGVPRHIAEYRLNVREGCPPVRQKKRSQAPNRNQQIGRNLEVYADDLVIKSRTEDEIIRDIEETFKTLREINMKLNPKKCTFGVEEGMFLGYKVNTKGIKVCPDKVDAVLSLPSPKCLKDVQKLNGKLASLNRFLAKSAEKSLPFFKTLKKCTKKSDFHWTEEAESAFKQMKQLIAKLPTLTALEEKEELIVYLAAAKDAVSAVLMTEREAKQMPIYFVSHALRGPKVNYTSMEKLVLALVHASKRLKRYFQAHPIIVITDQPIKQGQILADFLVERPEEDSPNTLMEVEEELPEP
ncbi:reverse transcriptase domain-containing protein [Tanacetum coccineum]